MPPPGVSDAVSAALHTGITTHLSGGAAAGGDAGAGPAWRPKGVLVSHLFEHRKAVNQMAVSNNGGFMISASDDETVKVHCRSDILQAVMEMQLVMHMQAAG